jgi:hypothetical protein
MIILSELPELDSEERVLLPGIAEFGKFLI